MENNRALLISMAGTRKTKHWPRTELTWAEFVEKLKTPVRSTESLDEYLNYAKVKQDELKDVGGFVGGTFAGDIRKAAYVEGRDLLTLDLDNIPTGKTEDILKRVAGLGCNAVVYSTRKHCEYKPRLRVIVPLDTTASADEYEPAARKLASLIGMEFCDPTTFDVARLMYWPSCCKDSEYICEVYDCPFCSLQGLLQMYGDWTDISQWPQVPGTDAVERRRLAKQENPTEKKGVIGAFCRTYSITEAMEKFIPGMYDATDVEGRYTYTGGSTVGGAVVYDGDLFLYSHHATDPCSGLLVNAFDLIRLHKFGDLDQEAKEGTPNSKLPSFMAMTRLASNDKAVSALLAKETFEKAQDAYDNTDNSEELDLAWLDRLARDGNGKIAKTINNAVLVLENDPLLKGKIVTDEFASCGLILGKVPWSKEDGKRRWKDEDDAGFYNYMELFYGITGRDKLDSALLIVSSQNKINDVTEIDISAVPKWKDLVAEMRIQGASKLPFGYFSVPVGNHVDSKSPLGVSVCSKGIDHIAEADTRYSQINWEYGSKETAVHIAESLLKYRPDTDSFEYPGGKDRLYRSVEYSMGVADKPLLDVFSPEIRDSSYYNGWNHLMRLIEFDCNLAYGTLSDPNNTDKTAEEVRASKQRSYSFVASCQTALQRALEDLVDAMSFWCDIYNLCPSGACRLSASWDDSIVVDSEKERESDRQDVAMGVMQTWEYRMKWYGEDEETAKRMVNVEPEVIE